MQQLTTTKQIIDQFLVEYLKNNASSFKSQSLSQEAFTHLTAFTTSGKSVRGGLFLLAAQALNNDNFQKNHADLLKVAAALELIQSGLLIHDDIIDEDAKRRGKDSTWQCYAKQTPNTQLSDHQKQHFGYSMAICLGSISQYLAFSLLEKLDSLPDEVKSLVRSHISQEITKTYFAEMLDEQITTQKTLPSKEQVLEMYLYKTARYTMVLPLQLAAIISQSSPETVEQLEKIGEALGLIFQIKDDEISLFATQEISGKSFASDLKTGKKTIFYLELLEKLPAASADRKIVDQLFGKAIMSVDEVAILQKIFAAHAQPTIQKQIEELRQTSLQLIKQLTTSNQTKELLDEMLSFSLQRDR